MNVAFFLIPKADVVWAGLADTMRHVLELLEDSGYTAIPLLDAEGCYVGTLTEGDLLRKLMRTPNLSVAGSVLVRLADVPRRTNVRAVGIDAQMEELLSRAIE